MVYKIVFIFSILLVTSCAKNEKILIYKNPSAPPESRVNDLLHRMTLEEKLAQLSEATCDDVKEDNQATTTKFTFNKYGHGVGTIHGFALSAKEYALAINTIQDFLINKTRLGIPAIFVSECLHGLVHVGATIYPQSIAMGSSWNPDLVWKVACQIREEVKATGVSQVLSPDLDLARELRWGRVEETYGEDPYLASRMGVTMIKGLQEGESPDSTILISTAKPFLAYCAPSGGLNQARTPGGLYDLYNTYLPPFKAAIQEANVLSVMSAYNSYNGEALNASKYIYTDLLRGKLGFKGYVYSDWGAVIRLHRYHRVAENGAKAGKLAIEAGIDLEAPKPECFQYLDSLIETGEVSMKTIDQAVSRILYVKFVSGLFEHPFVDASKMDDIVHRPAHVDLAKKMSDESIVLLKNDQDLLPLDVNKLKSIAVVGPNADQVQFGDYTWSRDNKDGVTVLEGIKNLVGNRVKIHYAKGCDIISLGKSGIREAVDAAKKSDIAIVVIGTTSASLARNYSGATSGEGFDLSDLDPTGVQGYLVREVYATGKSVIVVLVQGKPFSIPWMKEHIPAIVEAWYPGERGGQSVAEVLFGKLNPSGKLPVSFPQSVGHLPCYYNYLPIDKGVYKHRGSYGNPGRDYVFSSPDALWPFGYGLSYTTFSYENMSLSSDTLSFSDTLKVCVNVKNTGKREGKEVIQLYIRDEYSSMVRPVKELKAFDKVNITPGETRQVDLEVTLKDCGYYNNKGEYIKESGNFDIMVGSSSEDIHFTRIVYVNR